MLLGCLKTSDEFADGTSGTPLSALKTLTSKACEHNNSLSMEVRISKFRMLIGLNKTLDEFQNGHSETSLRALKPLL